MDRRTTIQTDLVKLSDGGRLLRLTDSHTGLALEKKLDAEVPVVRQRALLLDVFEAGLDRANSVQPELANLLS